MSRTPRRTPDPPSRGLNLRTHRDDARGLARRARPRAIFGSIHRLGRGWQGSAHPGDTFSGTLLQLYDVGGKSHADSVLRAIEVLTKRLSVDVDETVNQGTSCW